MPEADLTVFQQRLAERRAREEAARREAQAANQADQLKFDPELIPDEQYERSDEDREMDRVIESIDILEAYRRWCGKSNPRPRAGQTEGIKVSCPIPGHADKNPSAWVNTDKQTWYCGACDEGGDAHDLAAYHFGYPVPGYKEGHQFHDLRREMATDFGFIFTKMPGGVTVVTAPAPENDDPDGVEEQLDAEIIGLFEDDDDDYLLPTLEWEPLVPADTFLDAYMKATKLDDVPEEYHFWNGLLALGFALGRDVRLHDLVPVYGNLFVCTLGHSGAGKSKARYHLDQLLQQALPHDWSDANSKGIRKVSAPGSAEVLIHNFQKPVADPGNPKAIAYYAPVRGLIDFNELSSLMARANRQGNVSIPTLMQFYDMEGVIATSSMTHGAKEAHQPFASALTTTQPRALRGLLTRGDASSGFLNRWVFVPGKEKKRYAIGGVRVDMTPAVKPLLDVAGFAASFSSDEFMQWSPEAADLFTEFFHGKVQIDKKRNTSDMITRIDLLLKKLILLFTANRLQKTVPVESVKEAIACYDYLVASYDLIGGEIGTTMSSEISDAVLSVAKREWERSKKGITLSQLARTLHRRKYPHDLLIKTCDSLVKIGFLKLETTRAGDVGRPATRYRYVD